MAIKVFRRKFQDPWIPGLMKGTHGVGKFSSQFIVHEPPMHLRSNHFQKESICHPQSGYNLFGCCEYIKFENCPIEFNTVRMFARTFCLFACSGGVFGSFLLFHNNSNKYGKPPYFAYTRTWNVRCLAGRSGGVD